MTLPLRPPPAELVRGLVYLAGAMMLVPVMDAIAKHLSAQMPPLEIALSRFVLPPLIILPVLLRRGWAALLPPELGLHALRAVGIAGATLFFFSALQYMPMADTAAIFFVEPLILTVFSAVFLGESIGWRRVLAVLVGFAGAMLIVRPSFAEVGVVALLPLGAAVCFAGYMTATKLIAHRSDPWTLQYAVGVFGSVLLGAILWSGLLGEAQLDWPGAGPAALLVLMALVAVAGHTLIILAVRRVDAAVAAPFQYLEIIGATFWGYLIFGDFPDGLTWIGVAIIVGSGVFVFYREHRQARSG